MSSLVIDDLRIDREGQALVRLTAQVAPGEVLCVMGPSGSGKSTLLAALIGATGPGFAVSGRVMLGGRDLTGLPVQDRRIGLLYQEDVLFPHLSVAQNLGFGLAPGGTRDGRAAKIADMLGRIGLTGYGPRDPATLSGGQRARVALARMLLSAPQALLLDEPFARLDLALRAQMRALVFDMARDLPVVLVSHDPDDARAAGGRVVDVMGQPVQF